MDPERKPGTGQRTEFCPGAHGGKTWPPIAFSPQTRMIYVPANNNMCGAITGAPTVEYRAGSAFTGTIGGGGGGPTPTVPGADHYGELQAWNVDTRTESVDAQLHEEPELGVGARHGWRAGVQRWNQRSKDSRL